LADGRLGPLLRRLILERFSFFWANKVQGAFTVFSPPSSPLSWLLSGLGLSSFYCHRVKASLSLLLVTGRERWLSCVLFFWKISPGKNEIIPSDCFTIREGVMFFPFPLLGFLEGDGTDV